MLLSYDLAGTLAVKNMCLEGMGHRTNELSGKKKKNNLVLQNSQRQEGTGAPWRGCVCEGFGDRSSTKTGFGRYYFVKLKSPVMLLSGMAGSSHPNDAIQDLLILLPFSPPTPHWLHSLSPHGSRAGPQHLPASMSSAKRAPWESS